MKIWSVLLRIGLVWEFGLVRRLDFVRKFSIALKVGLVW